MASRTGTETTAPPGQDGFLFDWRRALCSAYGPPPTTRHVLLTVSLHMKTDGSSAFPSQDLLALETGLSLRAVKKHLKLAQALGWLGREPRRRRKASFRYGTYYTPRIPPGISPNPKAEKIVNGAPGAPNLVHIVPTFGERGSDLVNDVPASTSGRSSGRSSGRAQGKTPAQRSAEGERQKPAQQETRSYRQWAQQLGIVQQPGEHEGTFQVRVFEAVTKHRRGGLQ